MLMSMTMILLLIVFLLIGVGGIFLQIFLSKKENRLLGLLLPVVTFLYSLVRILSMTISMTISTWADVGLILRAFLVTNLSTLVLLAIYWICRDAARRKKQLEKMNIQDL